MCSMRPRTSTWLGRATLELVTAKLTAIGLDKRGRWRTKDLSELPSSLTRWTIVDEDERLGLNPVCATNHPLNSPVAMVCVEATHKPSHRCQSRRAACGRRSAYMCHAQCRRHNRAHLDP